MPSDITIIILATTNFALVSIIARMIQRLYL
jgi:hypothetical protein